MRPLMASLRATQPDIPDALPAAIHFVSLWLQNCRLLLLALHLPTCHVDGGLEQGSRQVASANSMGFSAVRS